MKSRTSELVVGIFVIIFGVLVLFGDESQWSGWNQFK